jgi:beta-1,4-mannosyl-glycoprotein beta-1,4-N-acetylglucosaminyltransferase
MKKIYDCFNFYNEFDILDLRFNVLDEYVDYFVIIESSVTHSGQPKKFFFDENKEKYGKFLDKIILYKVHDTLEDYINLPKSKDKSLQEIYDFILVQKNFDRFHPNKDYSRDFFQKESVRRALINCDDDDLILISDIDEIPNPEILKNLNDYSLDNTLYRFNQKMCYFYLNVLKDEYWCGTRMGLYKNLKNLSFNEVRGNKELTTEISNGGWHFSFMGGSEMVINKLTTYCHRDMVNDNIINNIENNILNNVDPFLRSTLKIVEIDETYPKYLLNNIEKYKHLIK